jgi:hypothetical protein
MASDLNEPGDEQEVRWFAQTSHWQWERRTRTRLSGGPQGDAQMSISQIDPGTQRFETRQKGKTAGFFPLILEPFVARSLAASILRLLI